MTRLAPDPEVLVVGAGPAGSTLAGLLAAEGCDVLVVDRAHFPREKACGECLNPGAVDALGRLGLLTAVQATRPSRLDGWDLHTPAGSKAEGRFGPGVGPALGIRRGAFDAALLDVARDRGARVMEGVQVQTVVVDWGRPLVRGRWTGTGGSGWSIRPRMLVGADGLRSVVARATGASSRPPRRIKVSLSWHLDGPAPKVPIGRLLLGGPFTSGLAPVSSRANDGASAIWTQTIVVDPSLYGHRLRNDPDGLRREALQQLLPDDRHSFVARGPARSSGPFDSPTRWIARGSTLLVGDAAGYFDPVTGQGIFRALRSAELAAPAILEALAAPALSSRRVAAYDQAVRHAFGPGRRLQRLLDRSLDHPWLREAGLSTLTRFPGACDTLVGVAGDRLPIRALASPSGWRRDADRSAPRTRTSADFATPLPPDPRIDRCER